MTSDETLEQMLRAREVYLRARQATIDAQWYERLVCERLSSATSLHERTIMREGKKSVAS